MTLDYDIIVIGGGHAGCEAASAAARLGSRTLLLTMDMGKMASMSCNPAVGGVAKGQIVREIDALGGQMGRITDLTTVQFRMLNRSKGAAMWSPRAQCDKTRFSEEWQHTLENTRNLYIWQDAATELLFDDALRTDSARLATPGAEANPNRNNLRSAAQTYRITGVRTRMGVEFTCRAVVLTSGTFLGGLMHCGISHAEGGRAGDAASHGITECLRRIGFESGRMKTGTPARLDARTIDFERLEPQYGDENPAKFSFSPDTQPVKDQLPCFLVYTSAEVHDILRSGFDQSPRATAPRSKTNSELSPIRTNISSFWNPKDARPMNIISTVFHRRCPGKCNGKRCIRFRDSKICTSIAPDTPSNTTIFRPRSCTIPSKPSWFRDSISPDRSTERPVTKKPQLRG